MDRSGLEDGGMTTKVPAAKAHWSNQQNRGRILLISARDGKRFCFTATCSVQSNLTGKIILLSFETKKQL
jgi:hypothetical protein